MQIYVGNLPWECTSADLRRMFEAFGAVIAANVVVDRDTGKSRGYGFVEMDGEDEALNAIAGLDGGDHEGRRLTVQKAD